MSKFRTPESLIRSIMSRQNLTEQTAVLSVPEPNRVDDAIMVLHSQGIMTATKKDEKTVTVKAIELLGAVTVLDNAVMHGMLRDKPIVVSFESLEAPALTKEDVNDKEELETGDIDLKTGKVELVARTLHNRKENQLKKIDETQIDELSRGTLQSYAKKADHDDKRLENNFKTVADTHASTPAARMVRDVTSHGILKKATQRADGVALAHSKLSGRATASDHKVVRAKVRPSGVKEEAQIDEGNAENKVKKNLHATKLGYNTSLLAMLPTKQGKHDISKASYMRIAAGQKGHSLDHEYKVTADHLKRAGRTQLRKEDVTRAVLNNVKNIVESMRLIGTHHSESGRHHAKVYKDHEWGEHRVKFYVNGTHKPKADYHTDDKEDAHGTAKHELARLDKHVTEASTFKPAAEEAKAKKDSLAFHKNMMRHFVEREANSSSRNGKDHETTKKFREKAEHHRSEWNKLSEEFDQLDEISKGTLINYVAKASKAVDHHHREARKLDMDSSAKFGAMRAHLHREKARKRSWGVDDAMKKLGEETLDETRDLSLVKAANRNIMDLKAGRVAKAVSAASARKKLADQFNAHHKAKFEHHKAKFEEHKAKYREHRDLEDDIESGAAGVEDHHKHGALEEIGVHTDHHAERMNHHHTQMHYHNNMLDKPKHIKEEVEQIDELSKDTLKSYIKKSIHSSAAAWRDDDGNVLSHPSKESVKTIAKRYKGQNRAEKKLDEDTLNEGKKDDLAVASAAFAAHPRADKMYQDMMHAVKHHNYVQDATDHVYSNNSKHVKYADWHAMKPHIEDEFKKHGLE